MAGPSETAPDAADCLACRGGGQVTSNLGGESVLVPCPWCEGSGLRLVGHDAQAHWRDGAAPGPAPGPGPGPGPGDRIIEGVQAA